MLLPLIYNDNRADNYNWIAVYSKYFAINFMALIAMDIIKRNCLIAF